MTNRTPFAVSVIIPVYRAEAFVREAVEAALAQPETAEVVLVEDGSPDGSLAVCQQLAAESDRVKLYQHPGGENRGAGASRTLAVQKATCEYLAFLDADDVFTEDRFEEARQILESQSDIDGVYGSIGVFASSEEGRRRWEAMGKRMDEIDGLKSPVDPEMLLETLLGNQQGSFSIIGLVIRRALAERVGPFDAHLRLHQDTAFMLKCAALGRLVGGFPDRPVALRRVHDHNRVIAPRSKAEIYRDRIAHRVTLWAWAQTHATPEQRALFTRYLIRGAVYTSRWNRPLSGRWYGLQKRFQTLLLLWENPILRREPAVWQELLPGFLHPQGKG